MRLNLIGNGFDLYHGLPSSYYYFGCFLAETDWDFYKEMANMFDFIYARSEGFPSDELIPVVDNIWWRDFEKMLGELNPNWLEESLLDDLALEYPEDPVDLEIPETNMSERIVRKFIEWISCNVNTKSNFTTIHSMIGHKKRLFRKDDYFINFNYTQTLREIYKVSNEQIFFIHGECRYSGDSDNLIVGHGNTEAIKELEKQISSVEAEGFYMQEQAARNRLNEFKAEKEVLCNLKKDVDSIIIYMKQKLNTNAIKPDEIWVWGLSCGDVDKPYIKALTEMYPNAKWRFSYYNETEKSERIKFSAELKIHDVEFFEFVNEDSKNIRDLLVKNNGIIECDIK